jgi:hypothetical protein
MLRPFAEQDNRRIRQTWISLIFEDDRSFTAPAFQFTIIGEPTAGRCEPQSPGDYVSQETRPKPDQSRQESPIHKGQWQVHQRKTPQPHPKHRAEDCRSAGHREGRQNQK